MKRAPIKILIVVIITGLACLLGQLVLSFFMDRINERHTTIMEEYVQNREYMENIKTLMYQHQALLANHLLSENMVVEQSYEEQEKNLRSELKSLIVDFSRRMKGGQREKLYHKVYSDYAGYEHNADQLLQFRKNGERDMAIFYNDNMLNPFLTRIDSNLETLDKMTIEEINHAEDEMKQVSYVSRIIRNVLVVIVIGLIIICTVRSVSITSHLDKYKVQLEKELEEKNKKLRERNEKMLQLQDGIIIGMANLIESRNGETGEHVKRTSAYVNMIARECKRQGIYADILTEEYIERLVKAAPLHDVGKICVSDTILLKPGRFTPEEFEEMKKHASKGGEIIEECFDNLEDKDYLNMAKDVANYHHEKWDGSGYCKGLSGEDIPLSARIMAVADVFDALISKRCYKEPMPLDKAFSIIEESAGTHFDPKIAEVFLSIREEVTKSAMSEC